MHSSSLNVLISVQVLAFNGKPVKNLKCLAEMVENCDDEYMEFSLDYDQVLFSLMVSLTLYLAFQLKLFGGLSQIVVLQTKTAKEATLDILTTHCIPSAMSDDLKN